MFHLEKNMSSRIQENKKDPFQGLSLNDYFFAGFAFLATLAFFTLAFGSFFGAFSFLARAFLPL